MTTTKEEKPATVATAMQTPPERPIATFRDVLGKMKAQLALALPKHLDADRMLRICFTTVQRTPLLLECNRETLLGAIMQCAQLGLEPDGLLGHAYLIPFKNKKADPPRLECQLIIGYKGLLKLARQSGEVASVSARVVYSKDHFKYRYGLVEVLEHVPYEEKDENDDSGMLTHAYAIFRFKDGSHHFEVMTVGEIERIRRKSPSGESPAWRDNYDEMCKKTAIRRAAKLSPASVEDKMARAIAIDERADAGLPQLLGDGDEPLALGAAQAQDETPKEGVRGPLRRPTPPAVMTPAAAKKPEDVISAPPPQGAVAGEIVQAEDPEAKNFKAAEPTPAEIAAREAELAAEGAESTPTTKKRAPWVDKK